MTTQFEATSVAISVMLVMMTGITLTTPTVQAQSSAQSSVQSSAEMEELKRTIEQQQRQLETQQKILQDLQQQLENLSQDRKPPTEPVAEVLEVDTPPLIESGNDNVRLSISGQVNRGLLYIDDGEETETFNVDNDNSSTRIRLIGEADVSDDLTIGTNIEVQFESNSTASVNQDDQRNVGPNNFTERKLELFADSKRWGKVSLGQGDTASNGTSEVDLSGTSVIGYSGVADLAGGILFRSKETGELTEINIGDAFSNLDGLSRDDRIRYDTPSFGGVKLSTSFIADDRYDASVRYGADFGEFKTAAALSYADPNDDEIDNRVNGSFSILHTSGINFTAAAGRDDRQDRDPEFYYVKLGYNAQLNSWGETAFSIDYYDAEDVSDLGDESTSYGAFVVQHLDNYATELYLGLRNYELDLASGGVGNVDDVLGLLAGARVKF